MEILISWNSVNDKHLTMFYHFLAYPESDTRTKVRSLPTKGYFWSYNEVYRNMMRKLVDDGHIPGRGRHVDGFVLHLSSKSKEFLEKSGHIYLGRITPKKVQRTIASKSVEYLDLP